MDQVPNDQLVKMPDGVVVGFPRDMPPDQVAALIEHKFPNQVKSARENTVDASGKIVPVNPMKASTPNRPQPLPTDLTPQFMSGVNEGIGATLSFPNQVAHSLESIGPTIVNAMGGHAAMPPESGYLPDAGKAYTNMATGMGAIQPPSADPRSQFVRSAGGFVGGMLVPGIGVEENAAKVGTNALRPAAAAARDFGIPLTKGQVSGDLTQLTKEEALRQSGGPAQNIMRNFDAAQQGTIGNVAGGIGSKLGTNPQDMRDLVTSAIQNKVAFHKDQASALYSIAADGGITIKPAMVEALPQIIDHSLEAANVVVDTGPGGLTPAASLARKVIEQDAGNLTQGMADFAAKGGGIPGTEGISLDGLERLRKKLVNINASATSPTDMAATWAVKTAFDDWLGTAVDNMLVSGDPAALDALKQARSSSHDYLSITNPNSGDQIGATVAKMASMDNGGATAEEVANWLYGADIVSPNLNAPKVAQRVKDLVGTDAWNAVRASAWERLTQDMATGDPRTATMMAKRIETFLNSKGTTLSNVLYSPAEREQMQKFADALKTTITPRDATNPSRTAWSLGKSITSIYRLLIGTSVGVGTGNAFLGFSAGMSAPVVKGIFSRSQAMKAIGQTPAKAATGSALSIKGNALRGALVGAGAALTNNRRPPVNALRTQGTGPSLMAH